MENANCKERSHILFEGNETYAVGLGEADLEELPWGEGVVPHAQGRSLSLGSSCLRNIRTQLALLSSVNIFFVLVWGYNSFPPSTLFRLVRLPNSEYNRKKEIRYILGSMRPIGKRGVCGDKNVVSSF